MSHLLFLLDILETLWHLLFLLDILGTYYHV